MKKIFFKMLIICCVVLSARVIHAQATPGNAGVDPGNSNGGSGIQTQPNINPNTLTPKQGNSSAGGTVSNADYSKGATSVTQNAGATSPRARKCRTKRIDMSWDELYAPENQPSPK